MGKDFTIWKFCQNSRSFPWSRHNWLGAAREICKMNKFSQGFIRVEDRGGREGYFPVPMHKCQQQFKDFREEGPPILRPSALIWPKFPPNKLRKWAVRFLLDCLLRDSFFSALFGRSWLTHEIWRTGCWEKGWRYRTPLIQRLVKQMVSLFAADKEGVDHYEKGTYSRYFHRAL